jgi:isopentenyldiphosphate isomerase
MKEYIPLVNEDDEIIGFSDIKTVHAEGLLHREAYVYIISKNKVLLQKRKDNGKWDHSSAGHFHKDETYVQGAQRETKEELGLDLPLSAFHEIGYFRRNTTKAGKTNNRFITVFLVEKEIPPDEYTIQKTEVLEIKYFDKTEVKTLLKRGNLTGSAAQFLEQFILKKIS